ncbi:MAG: tetratricopeptide repeat protein [Alphaproteobacteria bacterium]|nr:tetratricopeptide repeat protein [Alphaproteobacteria bacterium]
MTTVVAAEIEAEALAAIELLRRRGAVDEALEACRALMERYGDRSEPLLLAATISQDNGDAAAALDFLDRALAVDPGRVVLHYRRGRLLFDEGHVDRAEDAYRAALTIDPASARAHFALAALLEESGRGDDAAYHLRLAIGLDPADLDARERLARLLDEAGKPDQGAGLRRETMRRARRRIADEYRQIRTPPMGASEQAVHTSRLVWAQALIAFGIAGIGLAQYQERPDSVSEASQTYAETLSVLSEAAEQAGSLEGLRRILPAVARTLSRCHYEMAMLLERARQFGGAVYHLEEAMLTRPDEWPQGGERLGEVAWRCGETIDAVGQAVAGYLGHERSPAPFPITRWYFSRQASDWLVSVIRHRRAPAGGCQRRIAVLAGNPRDIETCFAMTCALLARGHAVDFLWMPCLHFDRGGDATPRYDSWDERLLAREMTAFGASDLPSGLRVIDLRDIEPAPHEIAQENAADRLALFDVRADARDHCYDTAQNPGMTRKYNRMRKNLDAMRRIATYLTESSIDRLILRNATMGEYGAAFHAARAAKVDVLAWEVGTVEPGTIQVSHNRRHGDHDIATLWAVDDGNILSAERNERVAVRLSARDSGDHRAAEPRQRHRSGPRGLSLLESLRLDAARPVVAMFLDRAWNEAAIDREAAFPSHEDWLRWTATFFGRHPEWQLVICPPPPMPDPEEQSTGPGIDIAERKLAGNVRVMDWAAPDTGYRLLDAAQLGLFYTDTIGLEMAAIGIHAITVARPFFAGLGFTDEAVNEEDYARRIQEALADPATTAMTTRQVELARCFADLYFHDTPKPFPWPEERFWQSVTEEWTMDRVLGEEGQARFGDLFAVLAGDIPSADGLVGTLR